MGPRPRPLRRGPAPAKRPRPLRRGPGNARAVTWVPLGPPVLHRGVGTPLGSPRFCKGNTRDFCTYVSQSRGGQELKTGTAGDSTRLHRDAAPGKRRWRQSKCAPAQRAQHPAPSAQRPLPSAHRANCCQSAGCGGRGLRNANAGLTSTSASQGHKRAWRSTPTTEALAQGREASAWLHPHLLRLQGPRGSAAPVFHL